MEAHSSPEEIHLKAVPQMTRSLWLPYLIAPNATSQRNARESPLLRLPGEIQNIILNYVLGGQTLHIEHTVVNGRMAKGSRIASSEVRLFNKLCLCTQTDQEVAGHLMNPAWEQRLRGTELWPNHMGLDLASFPSSHPLFIPGNPFFVRSFAARHSACFKMKETIRLNSPMDWGLSPADDSAWDRFGGDSDNSDDSDDFDNDSEDEESRPAPINRGLSLCCLRVCRQIYAEARHLPYTSNTFAFRSITTYKLFTPSLLETQRRLITKLNLLVIGLNIETQESHWAAWSRAISSVPLPGNLITDLHINHEISYSKAKLIKSIAPTPASGPPACLELKFLAMRVMGLSSNCRITTIVADMHNSLWSYQNWLMIPTETETELSFRGNEGRWRQWREENCLTVGEKGQVAVWINEAVGAKRGPKDKSKQ